MRERITTTAPIPAGRPIVSPNVQLADGPDVKQLQEQITRLVQACTAADYLICSLLAYRPGATDELLIEVRDSLRAAIAYGGKRKDGVA